MTEGNRFDVAVIGAGAAGLMAAARAAGNGARTIVLEKNRKAGVKILMSGGTRCNLTHDCDADGIMAAFGPQGKFLRQSLAALGPRETVALFNELGVRTKVESTGKVFPVNDRAVEVRDALQGLAVNCGARIVLGAAVQSIRRDSAGFFITTSSGDGLTSSWLAKRVIITSGGRSWPGCGTTGDGYQWLTEFGHTIEPTYPALVPLVGGTPWSHELSGLTLDHVRTSVIRQPRSRPQPSDEPAGRSHRSAAKPEVTQRSGSFLFTHRGFSGPAVMDVSRAITSAQISQEVRFVCDWVPDLTVDQLSQWLDSRRKTAGAQRMSSLIAEYLPKRLAEALSQVVGIAQTPIGELPKTHRQQLLVALKEMELPIQGSQGFEKAEVTAGGVRLSEVDPRTMASRLVQGLYIAGEILDLDGWIGGYNFQSAFSTGHIAGLHAAASLADSH